MTRPILTLKKKPAVIVEKQQELFPTKIDIDLVLKKIKETYPKAFDSIKPLKIGVLNDISIDGISRTSARKALALYCGSREYLQSVVDGKFRAGLDGSESVILDGEREYSLGILEKNKCH